MRLHVNQKPRQKPWRRNANKPYSEQLGQKRQHGLKNGLIISWYRRMSAVAKQTGRRRDARILLIMYPHTIAALFGTPPPGAFLQ